MRKRAIRMRRLAIRNTILLFVAFCVLLILSLAFVSHAGTQSVQLSYKSIKIIEGDNITRIACDYLEESGLSLDDMVYEIRRLNRISEDSFIYAGAYLVIPTVIKG